MVIKKYKKRLKEPTPANTTKPFPIETTKSMKRYREIKIPFAARVPASLYESIKDYLDKYGRRGESMNEIFMSGGFAELQKRLSIVGKNVDREIKINYIIDGIKCFLKELEDLK
jgi:hypothetical protein